MSKISEQCASDIIAHQVGTTNIPHPRRDGMRIVGFVVPEEKAQLGVGLLAMEDIAKAWRKDRTECFECGADIARYSACHQCNVD